MTGFIERVLSVQTLNNKRGCTQRVIVVNDVAQQFDDMPTPSAGTLGLIVQYTGETTADFTHGYFYEGTSSTTSSSATATQTVGSSLTDIAVDVETLETFTGWTTDNSLQIFYTDDGWSVDTTSLGVTYTGTPSVGDAITISYTAGVTTYGWQQVDVQPSGGGDEHNLGWYATQSALETAHPTAETGDWAIVGSTDTVWIWDTDTNAWKDSDQKGQVASVNGQTGAVVLTASDVGAATSAQGALADTAIQSVKTINGQSIVGTGDVTVGGLPDQTDQSGKFLTTDGTDASWSDKPLVNNATSSLFPDTCLSILGQNNQQGYVTTVGAGTQSSGSGTAVGYAAKANGQYGVAVGRESVVSGDNGVAIGYRNTAGRNGVCLGDSNSMSNTGVAIGKGVSSSGFNSISIGFKVGATAAGAIQLGGNANLSSNIINNETGTFKVCLSTSIANTFNYKLLDIDGTIPAARHAALPSADGTYVLKLVIADGVPTLSWVVEQ